MRLDSKRDCLSRAAARTGMHLTGGRQGLGKWFKF